MARQPQKMTVEAWLKFTLQDLREAVSTMKIKDTGELLASIQGHLVASAGDDVERLSIAYALYGKFQDMGVGRGMGAGVRKGNDAYTKIRDEKGQLYRHSRKKRQWWSKQIYRQTLRLGTLLSEYYGETMVAMVQDTLPGIVEINL